VFNAANEVAVAAFLAGRIPFGAIPTLIEGALSGHPAESAGDLESVLAADRTARARVTEVLP